MNFAFDDVTSQLRVTLRSLFAAHSPSSRVRATEASESGHDRELWRVLGASGMLGLSIPEARGGQGGDARHEGVLAEEAGRVVAPIALVETARAVRLLEDASAAEADTWLRRVLTGECVVVALDATAEARPQLWLTSNVVSYGAGVEGFLVRVASGATALVPTADPSVVAIRQPSLGPAPIARVELRGAPYVPLGVLDWEPADRAAECAAVAWAAGGIGGLLDYVVAYLKERQQFGRPVGSFQAVQHRVADMARDHELACLLAAHATAAAAGGRPVRPALDAALAVGLEGYRRASASACQLLGGYGFMSEYDTQLHFRAAKRIRTLFPPEPALRRLGDVALSRAATGVG